MLIEVMIGAVILALATTAVLNGIDGAQKTGGRNKARSVAAALAEQDQERMRSLPVSSLVPYVTAPLVRTVKVKGVDYSVKSLATWATDPGGVTTSCSSTTKTQANLRIVSQVTSPLTRGTVDLASLVTPPPGAGFSTGEGRVIVKVVDRDQAAIAGASVTLSGGSSYSDLTNAAGCAVFPFVPAGNYTASASSGTMVGWQGESPVTKATSSTAGISTAMTLEIDRPSHVQHQLRDEGGQRGRGGGEVAVRDGHECEPHRARREEHPGDSSRFAEHARHGRRAVPLHRHLRHLWRPVPDERPVEGTDQQPPATPDLLADSQPDLLAQPEDPRAFDQRPRGQRRTPSPRWPARP